MAIWTWWTTRRRPHVLSPQIFWPDRVSPDRQERPRRRQTAAIRRRHPRPRRRDGQDGTLERLLRSGARFAHSAVVLTAYEKGEATAIATRQLGPALALERLWRETGCKQVISALAAEREFQFDLVVAGRTRREAEDKYREYHDHASIEGGLAHLSSSTGLDFSHYQLDEPIRYVKNDAINSAVEMLTTLSTEPWTLR